jgi:hypothetical protein
VALPPLWPGTSGRVSCATEDSCIGFVAYAKVSPDGRAFLAVQLAG